MIATRVLFFAAMWDIASASLKLVGNDVQCDLARGEVLLPSATKTADVAACLSSCSSAPACKSVTFFPNGYCSHFATRCTSTVGAGGAKSYADDADPIPSTAGSKHLGEQCSEGAMAHPGYFVHADLCVNLCAQTTGCHSITYASDGYCFFYTSDCKKRNSLSGAVSFQAKQFSTRAVYDITDCQDCQKKTTVYSPNFWLRSHSRRLS
jgi:hypothetical protein